SSSLSEPDRFKGEGDIWRTFASSPRSGGFPKPFARRGLIESELAGHNLLGRAPDLRRWWCKNESAASPFANSPKAPLLHWGLGYTPGVVMANFSVHCSSSSGDRCFDIEGFVEQKSRFLKYFPFESNRLRLYLFFQINHSQPYSSHFQKH
uniref:Uncharacterized protein n=1 Tax=Parascaris univalens TaxID=6257 RepID=A0A915AME7_PARUN